MLDEFDYVFFAEVNEAVDYDGNSWSVDWPQGLSTDEVLERLNDMAPTDKATITTREVFKGNIKARKELIFRDASGLGNCRGGYYFNGEERLFFLNENEDGTVRPSNWCSPSSQYIYDIKQIRNFYSKNDDPKILSMRCLSTLRGMDKFFDELSDDRRQNVFSNDNCVEHLEDFRAGKFYTPNQSP